MLVSFSIGSKPLQIWDKKVRNGHIKRITDQDIQVRKLNSDKLSCFMYSDNFDIYDKGSRILLERLSYSFVVTSVFAFFFLYVNL